MKLIRLLEYVNFIDMYSNTFKTVVWQCEEILSAIQFVNTVHMQYRIVFYLEEKLRFLCF